MGDRHAFRAKWHDYDGGVYFVTICSHKKHHLFGTIADCKMQLSCLGKNVEECTKSIPQYYDNVELWNYVVMPNHVHMVLSVGTRFIASTAAMPDAANIGCLKQPRHGNAVEDYHHNSRLASIVGAYKAGVTRTARTLYVESGEMTTRTRRIASLQALRIWQPRYHEHIIRSQFAFDYIMDYIDNNITNWNKDCFYK